MSGLHHQTDAKPQSASLAVLAAAGTPGRAELLAALIACRTPAMAAGGRPALPTNKTADAASVRRILAPLLDRRAPLRAVRSAAKGAAGPSLVDADLADIITQEMSVRLRRRRTLDADRVASPSSGNPKDREILALAAVKAKHTDIALQRNTW